MKKPRNSNKIQSSKEKLVVNNTEPFFNNSSNKINFHECDVSLIDLAELVDMNPVDISNYEKRMIAIFLDILKVDLDSKVVIDITTTPHELACYFLMAIRSMPRN